jgi:hypothetical protein
MIMILSESFHIISELSLSRSGFTPYKAELKT